MITGVAAKYSLPLKTLAPEGTESSVTITTLGCGAGVKTTQADTAAAPSAANPTTHPIARFMVPSAVLDNPPLGNTGFSIRKTPQAKDVLCDARDPPAGPSILSQGREAEKSDARRGKYSVSQGHTDL